MHFDEVIMKALFFQERDIKQLLLEVKALEQSASGSSATDLAGEGDSPKLAALKLQNSKLKYRIIHLQKVLIKLQCCLGTYLQPNSIEDCM